MAVKTKKRLEKEISPCSCGGLISWNKENVKVYKDVFKQLEVGTCGTCTAKYLTDDSADLILEKYERNK